MVLDKRSDRLFTMLKYSRMSPGKEGVGWEGRPKGASKNNAFPDNMTTFG